MLDIVMENDYWSGPVFFDTSSLSVFLLYLSHMSIQQRLMMWFSPTRRLYVRSFFDLTVIIYKHTHRPQDNTPAADKMKIKNKSKQVSLLIHIYLTIIFSDTEPQEKKMLRKHIYVYIPRWRCFLSNY
jgi:hypothetical protein